ncbi:GNAT family N-acetyltransferase [Oceanospirillum sediminis]|uniref:GNAT family N-acetyltransferase n=1 Tax=Oceanospirillum sediminis TaxID=2760088 RepID=A0A839IUW6_9GAMM|nr:GNAT family N-acetyltransferase [Oceanospirillum sediminis]MBB1489243.1 GNAT family N-acetyltransferase [Oceanospirillum sediminis]
MSVVLKTVSGHELVYWIEDLARLRIQIFREYPYLYDGTTEYEQDYLATYIESGQAMAVLAVDCKGGEDKIVGASTGVPMSHESEEFRQPFLDAGIDTDTLFYCGESVLLPEYRGQGIYKGFFSGREQYVRRLGGFQKICFCGVMRADDHPMKPEEYQPLDAVWQHFGYQACPELTTCYPWKDIDQPESSDHLMMFWMKTL